MAAGARHTHCTRRHAASTVACSFLGTNTDGGFSREASFSTDISYQSTSSMGERQKRISIRRRDGKGVMEEAGNKRRKGQRKVWRREEDAAVHQSREEPPSVK